MCITYHISTVRWPLPELIFDWSIRNVGGLETLRPSKLWLPLLENIFQCIFQRKLLQIICCTYEDFGGRFPDSGLTLRLTPIAGEWHEASSMWNGNGTFSWFWMWMSSIASWPVMSQRLISTRSGGRYMCNKRIKYISINQKAPFQYKDHLFNNRIHIIKVRPSWDCLIFIMGVPLLVRQHLYTIRRPFIMERHAVL